MHARDSFRVHRVDDFCEWQSLMVVRAQEGFLHSSDQFLERGVTSQVHTHGHDVKEATN